MSPVGDQMGAGPSPHDQGQLAGESGEPAGAETAVSILG